MSTSYFSISLSYIDTHHVQVKVGLLDFHELKVYQIGGSSKFPPKKSSNLYLPLHHLGRRVPVSTGDVIADFCIDTMIPEVWHRHCMTGAVSPNPGYRLAIIQEVLIQRGVAHPRKPSGT
jgi:hypothetical protein